MLAQLYAKENATAKPWRQPVGEAGGIRAERPRRRVGCVKRSADTTPRTHDLRRVIATLDPTYALCDGAL